MRPTRHTQDRGSNRRPNPTGEVDDRRDAGQSTVEYLMWAALIVVVIVGLVAAVQLLGADVIGFVRDEIGID